MIDLEEAALQRLAVLPPPSVHAVAFNNRRDVVLEDEARIHFDAVAAAYLHELRVQLAWLARRARRELWA